MTLEWDARKPDNAVETWAEYSSSLIFEGMTQKRASKMSGTFPQPESAAATRIPETGREFNPGMKRGARRKKAAVAARAHCGRMPATDFIDAIKLKIAAASSASDNPAADNIREPAAAELEIAVSRSKKEKSDGGASIILRSDGILEKSGAPGERGDSKKATDAGSGSMISTWPPASASVRAAAGFGEEP